MKFSNKTYDCLKWIFTVVLPAVMTLYGVIGTTCNIPCTEQTLTIGAAVITCGCVILGISSNSYASEQNFLIEMAAANAEEEKSEETTAEE